MKCSPSRGMYGLLRPFFRMYYLLCCLWIFLPVYASGDSSDDDEFFDAFHLKPMQDFPADTFVEEIQWNDPIVKDPFQFYQRYTASNKPVVIRNLAHSMLSGLGNGYEKLRKKGPDAFFRETFMEGGYKVMEIETKKIEVRGGPSELMTFDQFVKEIDNKKRRDELYAVVDLDPEFDLLKLLRFPQFANCREHAHRPPIIWYSAGGTSSVLHHDDADNLLLVLGGTKQLILAHQDEWENLYTDEAPIPGSSPIKQNAVDLEYYPDFRHVLFQKATLREGDALLIPHSYWHQVVSTVADSGPFARRNVAINFWWAHRDDWRWWNPAEQDVFDELVALKDFDRMRKGHEFECTPRPVATFDNIRLVDWEEFKDKLARKRHPLVKNRYQYAAYPDLHRDFSPALRIDEFFDP